MRKGMMMCHFDGTRCRILLNFVYMLMADAMDRQQVYYLYYFWEFTLYTNVMLTTTDDFMYPIDHIPACSFYPLYYVKYDLLSSLFILWNVLYCHLHLSYVWICFTVILFHLSTFRHPSMCPSFCTGGFYVLTLTRKRLPHLRHFWYPKHSSLHYLDGLGALYTKDDRNTWLSELYGQSFEGASDVRIDGYILLEMMR